VIIFKIKLSISILLKNNMNLMVWMAVIVLRINSRIQCRRVENGVINLRC